MKLVFEAVIFLVIIVLGVFLYQTYWDDVKHAVFGEEPQHTIYLDSTALNVTVADEHAERLRGLSGVAKLDDFEGKLFIFDEDAKHGIWMKDMLIPLDILWINSNLEVIHIEENVLPSTYPDQIFAPPSDARFVLELNAYFVRSINVVVGDRLNLSSSLLPRDIRENLQK